TAGEPDLLVNNAHLAVTAVVLLEGGFDPRLTEPLDVDTGIVHRIDEAFFYLEPADRVDEHSHTEPGASAVAQRFGEVSGRLALPVDVGHQVDGALSVPDGVEHGREDLVAVAQDCERVSLGEMDADQAFQRPAQGPMRLVSAVLARCYGR